MKALALTSLLVLFAREAFPQMTPSEAFTLGKGVGAGGAPAVGAAISPGSAPSTVPHFSTTQPQSSLFGDGAGALAPRGADQVTGCGSGPSNPDGRAQQQCEATNFLSKKSTAAKFNIPPGDPVLARAKPITGDPQSILGSMSGSYSACTPQTVSAPARKQIEVCTETRLPEQRVCQRILTVTVTSSESCVPGTWFAGGGADRNAVDHMTGRIYCDPGRGLERHLVQVYAYGANGACSGPLQVEIDQTRPGTPVNAGTLQPHWENACRSTPAQVIAGGCSGKDCSARFDFFQLIRTWDPKTRSFVFLPSLAWSFWVNYQVPEVLITEGDSWDDQCTPYEARL